MREGRGGAGGREKGACFLSKLSPSSPLSLSNIPGDSQASICITIEPGLLLKGDILVSSTLLLKCPFSCPCSHSALGTRDVQLLPGSY